MKVYFDHEKLNVYQVSLVFNEWVGQLLPSIEAKAAAKDQLARAATSIPLNIGYDFGSGTVFVREEPVSALNFEREQEQE
jgi:hypothetical protein